MKNIGVSLQKLIFKNQQKTSLIPLIFFTLTIFLLFFLLLIFISNKHLSIYLSESEKNIINFTKQSSIILNEHLSSIGMENENFAKSHSYLVNNSDKFKPLEEKLIFSSNGSLFKQENDGHSIVYSSARSNNLKSEQKLIALTSSIDYLYKNIVSGNRTITSTYFASVNGLLRAYPFVSNIDKKIGSNLHLIGPSHYAKNKNINRRIWSDVYNDSVENGWMTSCIFPVYKKEKLEGITGIDISINNISKKLLDQWTFKNSESFLLDKKGRLIAAQKDVAGKFKLQKLIKKLQKNANQQIKPTSINLLNLDNKNHVKILKNILSHKTNSGYLLIENKHYFITGHLIRETGWVLFSITEQSKMIESLMEQLVFIKQIYYTIFGLIFFLTLIALMYFIYKSKELSKQISSPILQLTEAIKKAANGKFTIKKTNIIEIDELALYFHSLLTKLKEKQIELEELNQILQIKFEKEVTKNREQERLVFQQARLLQMGELIGNIAHQWRQPLNGIALIIQSLSITDMDGNLTSNFLEEQCKNAMLLINNMSSTIDNFRNFFKAGDEVENFKIEKQIIDTIDIVRNSFEDRGIEFINNFQNNATISANKQVFSQILLNLFSNAENAFKERCIETKVIKINTYLVDNNIQIEICDSAGGIQSDILPNIFDPFFSTKNQLQDAGLGLYMSKILIGENLNGTINVENKYFSIKNNKYSGACFTIILPVV